MESINNIPKRKYEGYVWYSNNKEPMILTGEEFSFNEKEFGNPFVIEALLYDREYKISVMVKHTGRYLIKEFDLKVLPESAVLSEEKEYYPHRLGNNISKICFKQLWLPEEDENCEEMKVLTIKAIIFTGFKY